MNFYSGRKIILQSYFFTLGIILVTSLFFSAVFYFLPLRNEILTLFANLTLTFAVFSGAYFEVNYLPYPKFSQILIFTVMMIMTFWVLHLIFGDFDPSVLTKKTIAIIFADLCGVISSRF